MKSIAISFLTLCVAITTASAADPTPAAKPKRAADPNLAKIEDTPGLPRVLLIGDSISIGYTLPVRDLLKGKANVHRIPTNGGPTTNGLKNLTAWLGVSKWDVIHFNWGLHDLKYVGNSPSQIVNPRTPGSHPQVSLADYESNLTLLVAQIRFRTADISVSRHIQLGLDCGGI